VISLARPLDQIARELREPALQFSRPANRKQAVMSSTVELRTLPQSPDQVLANVRGEVPLTVSFKNEVAEMQGLYYARRILKGNQLRGRVTCVVAGA